MAGLALQTLATITCATTAGGSAISTGQLCTSVYLEADSGNSGNVYIGDINVASTRYMTVLSAGKGIMISADYPSKAGASNLQMSTIFSLGSAASQKLHVTFLERMGG